MANRDTPMGFQFGYTKHGGPPQLSKYYSSGAATIYQGDLVKMSTASAGFTSLTATTDMIIGVCAAYHSSTVAGAACYLYDDLANTVFIAQASTTVVQGTSLCYLAQDITVTAGTTASERSLHEINAGTSTVENIYVIDKVDRPDNDWGGWVDLYCEIPVGVKTDPSLYMTT
jgi:hypothetical protein